MIKYVAALDIITFFGILAERRVGIYHELILVQHWPKTSFFWQHMNRRDESVVAINFEQYLRHRRITLTPLNWVIHGLWPVQMDGQYLSYCETSNGVNPTYSRNDLNRTAKEELKTKWPVLRRRMTEESLWASEYNMYGCCVSILSSYYFDTALILLTNHNVGRILDQAGIHPGSTYELDHIANAITGVVRRLVYLKCLPAQNRQLQYLLEIQLCFDPLLRAINCIHPTGRTVIYDCHTNRRVIYF